MTTTEKRNEAYKAVSQSEELMEAARTAKAEAWKSGAKNYHAAEEAFLAAQEAHREASRLFVEACKADNYTL